MKYTYEQVLKFAQDLSAHTGSNKYNDKKYKDWAEIQKELEESNTRATTSEKDFSNLIMAIAQAKKYLNDKDKASILPQTLDSGDRNSKLDANLARAIGQFSILKKNNGWFAPFSSIDPNVALSQQSLPVVISQQVLPGAPKPVSAQVHPKPTQKPTEASSTKLTYEQALKFAQDLSNAAKVAGPSKYNEAQYYSEKEKQYKNWDKITWDEIESLLKDNGDLQRDAFIKKGGLADYVMVIAQAKKFLNEQKPGLIKFISEAISKSRNKDLDDKMRTANNFLKSFQSEKNPVSHPDWYPGVLPLSDAPSNAPSVAPVSNAKGKPELSGTHYAYEAKSNEEGRWYHAFKADAETLQGEQYKGLTGDRLKTKILENLKKQIETFSTQKQLDDFKTSVKDTAEYKVLDTSQGVTTRVINYVGLFGHKNTSSIDALDKMINERTEQFGKGNEGPQH